jgi:hypothetical protein
MLLLLLAALALQFLQLVTEGAGLGEGHLISSWRGRRAGPEVILYKERQRHCKQLVSVQPGEGALCSSRLATMAGLWHAKQESTYTVRSTGPHILTPACKGILRLS